MNPTQVKRALVSKSALIFSIVIALLIGLWVASQWRWVSFHSADFDFNVHPGVISLYHVTGGCGNDTLVPDGFRFGHVHWGPSAMERLGVSPPILSLEGGLESWWIEFTFLQVVLVLTICFVAWRGFKFARRTRNRAAFNCVAIASGSALVLGLLNTFLAIAWQFDHSSIGIYRGAVHFEWDDSYSRSPGFFWHADWPQLAGGLIPRFESRRGNGLVEMPLFSIAFALFIIAPLIRPYRQIDNTLLPLCPQCGYSLFKNQSGRCPECGTSPTQQTLADL